MLKAEAQALSELRAYGDEHLFSKLSNPEVSVVSMASVLLLLIPNQYWRFGPLRTALAPRKMMSID